MLNVAPLHSRRNSKRCGRICFVNRLAEVTTLGSFRYLYLPVRKFPFSVSEFTRFGVREPNGFQNAFDLEQNTKCCLLYI